jgi:hypothetical protein
LALLINALLHHHGASDGSGLITARALIWLTDILMFGLWYREMDRGGRDKRAAGRDGAPDFLFPQMNDDGIPPMDWRAEFVDYLYVSLTNAPIGAAVPALQPNAESVLDASHAGHVARGAHGPRPQRRNRPGPRHSRFGV